MIVTDEITEQAAWDAFVALRPEANFLQSWQWGELHRALGAVIIRCGIYDNDQLIGVWQGIIKDARRGRYLEIPGGPLIDYTDKSILTTTIAAIRETARQHHCVFARLRPQHPESEALGGQLREAKLQKAPMHLHAEHTNILDLGRSENELLAAMRRQTRYEVRRADKQAITIDVRSDQLAIEEFFAMQIDTAKRQGW